MENNYRHTIMENNYLSVDINQIRMENLNGEFKKIEKKRSHTSEEEEVMDGEVITVKKKKWWMDKVKLICRKKLDNFVNFFASKFSKGVRSISCYQDSLLSEFRALRDSLLRGPSQSFLSFVHREFVL